MTNHMLFLLGVTGSVYALSTVPAYADGTGGGAQDLLNSKQAPDAVAKPQSQIKVGLSCTDDQARIYKQGDAGYEACMSQAGTKQSARHDTLNSSQPGAAISIPLSK